MAKKMGPPKWFEVGNYPRSQDTLVGDPWKEKWWEGKTKEEEEAALKKFQEQKRADRLNRFLSVIGLGESIEAGAAGKKGVSYLEKGFGALPHAKQAAMPGFLREYSEGRLQKGWNRIKQGVREFIEGHNRRTNALCLAAMGIAFAGGLAATVALIIFGGPVLAPVIGAAAATTLLTLAAPIGIALSTGLASLAWIGTKWVAKKIFKREKKYNLSDEVIQRWKDPENFNFSENLLVEMNCYLVNREERLIKIKGKDHEAVKALNLLRRIAVRSTDPGYVSRLVNYFLHEFEVLQTEKAKFKESDVPSQLAADLKVVTNLLNAFKEAKAISGVQKATISAALNPTLPSDAAALAFTPKPASVGRPESVRPSGKPEKRSEVISIPGRLMPDQLAAFEDNLAKKLEGIDVTLKRKEGDWSAGSSNPTRTYQLEIKPDPDQNDVVQQSIFMSESQVGEKYHTTFLVEKKSFDQSDDAVQNKVIEALVQQAKAYREETGTEELLVFANGDKKLAIQLMLAAKIAGLSPELEQRFKEKERKEIEQEVNKAFEAYEAKRLKEDTQGRVGFRMKKGRGAAKDKGER